MKNLSQNFPQEFQFQYIIQCCLRSVTVLLTHKMQLLQKFYYCFCCGCCQYYSHILFRNRKLVAEKKLLFLSLYLSPSHYSFFFFIIITIHTSLLWISLSFNYNPFSHFGIEIALLWKEKKNPYFVEANETSSEWVSSVSVEHFRLRFNNNYMIGYMYLWI